VPKKSRSGAILEFYRRAAEARRMADAATNRSAKADFLAIEQRWFGEKQQNSHGGKATKKRETDNQGLRPPLALPNRSRTGRKRAWNAG
jgi:hypothetical protein